jgi:hypothetical protein
MESFDLDNLEKELTQEARDAMLNVILSWARFDAFVSKWVSVTFGTSADATVILMGNMDTRNKLDKLKALYLHFGFLSGATKIEDLKKAQGEHVDVRNAIAHRSCVGQIRGDPEKVVFMSIRRVKGMPGHSFVEVMHLSQMIAATEFALHACDNISRIIDAVEVPLSESAQEPSEAKV